MDNREENEEKTCHLLILHRVKEYQEREVRDAIIKLFNGKLPSYFEPPFKKILENTDMIPECWVYEGEISFKMLTDKGWSPAKRKLIIHTASTLQEYRNLWKECPHQAVLLDLFLPENEMSRPRKETGLKVLNEIKREHPQSEVIVLTDQTISDWGLEVINKGAYYFIEKPHISLNLVKVLVTRIIQMSEGSYLDFLTGLYNKKFFETSLGRLWKEFRKKKERRQLRKYLSLILIDLDNFKNVNDMYGHPNGDLVLEFLANRIRPVFRVTDIVARIGGDEFAIIAPNMDHKEALKRAQELKEKVETKTVELTRIIEKNEGEEWGEKEEVTLTISIGLATYPQPNFVSELTELKECADQALYKAKETKSNNLSHDGKYIVYGYSKSGKTTPCTEVYEDKETS